MIRSRARITAIGGYAPETPLTNADMEKLVDTTDEWIVQRTGIENRFKTTENEFTSDLATRAALNLKENYPDALDNVDYVIVATFTPDYYSPHVSAIVHGNLGLPQSAGVMDINAACAGFVQALYTANGFITAGMAKKVLVIGAESITKVTDYTDRTTCVLFGDGAAAMVLEEDENLKDDEEGCFITAHFGADGTKADAIYATGLSATYKGTPLNDRKVLTQDGQAIYNFAMKTVPRGMKTLLKKADITVDQLDWFIPHSANLRMIMFFAKTLGLPMDKVLTSVEKYGNTSAASIPLALWEGVKAGKVKKGDLIAMYGFGGGVNHSGLLIRW